MSHLKLYAPPADAVNDSNFDADQDAFPREDRFIVPFDPVRRAFRIQATNLSERARAFHLNRNCPQCRNYSVEPVELFDGLYDRNQKPIPGTATLVAFHCKRCHHEWPHDAA